MGYSWNLNKKLLSIPDDKIEKLLLSIDKAPVHSSLPVRQLASFTGSIISNMLVFGNVCRFMTNRFHRAVNRKIGLKSDVVMDLCARKELEFWKANVSSLNSGSLHEVVKRPTRIVYSVASAGGCAAFISIDNMPVGRKNWDSLEMKQSSSWSWKLHCVSFVF